MTISTHHKSHPCPCGSKNDYTHCCGRYIETNELPEYPEQLMRSRYTAYVLNNTEYLLTTWHKHTHPDPFQLDSGIIWINLEIIDRQSNQLNNNEGWVEFVAKFNNNGCLQSLHERSRFLREDGRWFYVDGHIYQPPMKRVSRNAPCPCGSGKKLKHCCIE